jgi:hypothetical protein
MTTPRVASEFAMTGEGRRHDVPVRRGRLGRDAQTARVNPDPLGSKDYETRG